MDIAMTFNLAILLTVLVSLFVFIYQLGRAAQRLDTLQDSVEKLTTRFDSFESFVREELQSLRDQLQSVQKSIIRIETRLDYQEKSTDGPEKT
jgi:Tfp pilus assembly protein PilO